MSAIIRVFQWIERSKARFVFIAGTVLSVLALFTFRHSWSGKSTDAASPALQAWVDTRDIAFGLRSFYADNEKWPASDLIKICAALKGDNPTQKIYVFEVPRHPTGVFVDPWGTPYLIDLNRPDGPRVYSCGPNKTDEAGEASTDDIASWR